MTKVSPVSDLAAFLATLSKSNLLAADEFASLSESLGQAGDPKSAARELIKQNKLTRWQATQLLHGFHQLVYGKYKLMDQIGSGEMGRVYLAEHGQLGRRVALKALSRKHTADAAVLKAFLTDARRVGALDHPNLSHMYDVNQEGDRYFLVMEYVEGQNLQLFVEKAGKLPIAKVIDIAKQVAEGLGHAHEKQVLHGDLKPTNIVVEKTGLVKILDIGLFRLTESSATSTVEDTSETASLASGIYRPTEQIEGKGVDERTDWYSFGALVCFLLTGKPFEKPDACRSPEELKKLRPDAPQPLIELCSKLIAENPADRPASLEAVSAALAEAEKEAVKKAVPPKAAEPAPRAAAAPARPKLDAAPAPAKTDSSAGKPRKPPVARPLSDTPSAGANDTIADAATEAFSFNINTGSMPAKKPPQRKPAAAAAAASTPVIVSDSSSIDLAGASVVSGSKASSKGSSKSAATSAKSEKAAKGGSKLPLIIGGVAGGGVLVLLLAGGLIYFLMSGGDSKQVAANPTAAKADDADTSGDTSDTSESNPEEANPIEANPVEANPVAATAEEANPEAPAAEAVAMAAEGAEPTSSEGSGSDAAPAEDAPADAPADEPKSEAPPAEPASPPPPKEEAKPAPPPEPPKPAPKAAPPANPFAGFAKALDLPPLSGSGDEASAATTPVALGPCKVDEKALIILRLLGGETALRSGKQTFLLDAANGGTAERDWEIRCGTENENVVVATLSAKDGQLMFQWTDEGVKNPASPYLANCMLEMSAGSGNHKCGLRKPVTVEPLVIDLDKPNAGAKWTIEALPDERLMEVEVVTVQSGAPKSRIDNSLLTADRPQTSVMLGTADDKLPLVFELRMSSTAKQVEVKSAAKIKMEGLPAGMDRFNKRTLQTLGNTVETQTRAAELNHMQANQIKNADQKKKALASADLIKEQVAKAKEQVEALKATSEAAKQSTIHFRVWYLADSSKVLLLDTGGPPPPEPKKKS